MTPPPLVIAHRGASDDHAEHTVAAYQRAIDDGADGLECDVRLTADGVPVCMHDRRIDRTSGDRGVVSAKTYSELASLDYSSWKERGGASGAYDDDPDDLADDAPPNTEGLLRLDGLIGMILAADRPIDLSIETKHPVRFGGLVEERVIAVLRRCNLLAAESLTQVRMMSFSEVALRRVRALAPGLPTAFLMERVPVRCRTGWLPSGARIAGPSMQIVRAHPEYVARVHSAGSAVHVWVADQPEDVDLCLSLGVDAIITNRPRAVLERIGR